MDLERRHERRIIVTERKSLNDTHGIIFLDKLAKPETVEVWVLGKPLTITQFDEFGQPILTARQLQLCQCENNALNRQTRTPSLLEADVCYEEDQPFNLKRFLFDDLWSISLAMKDLDSLDLLLSDRRKFHKAFPDEKLKEYLLFGHIKLDAFGQVAMATNDVGTPVMIRGLNDVEPFQEKFLGTDRDKIFYKADSAPFPKPGSFCPICGKPITIDDIKEPSLLIGDCHRDCELQFFSITEEDRLCELMYGVYPDYNFTKTPVKPGSPCKRYCFETIDGHISLDSAEGDNRVRIAWHKDYLPFDTRNVAPEIYMIDECLVVRTQNLDDAKKCLLAAKRSTKN